MRELVSALLPVYNERLSWVQRAIESIANQTYSSIEIIIGIDNPNRTDVIDWINAIDDKRIKVYVNKENIGLVENLNKGLKYCSGQYIARMDADDISLEDRIEKELFFIKKNNLDLVATNVIKINNDGEITGKTSTCVKQNEIRNFLKKLGSFPHPTWLVKKEVFDKLQGYRKISLAEDYDFLVRSYLSGVRMGIMKEQLLYYRQNLNGITQTDKGKQRFTTLVLRKQIIAGRIFEICEIEKDINNGEHAINQYREMYAYTRRVRLAMQGKIKIKESGVLGVKMCYLGYLIKDYWIERFG